MKSGLLLVAIVTAVAHGAHQGDWAYAVDFKMPEGTDNCAAREGQGGSGNSKIREYRLAGLHVGGPGVIA